jgi:predicted aspartyl protease
MGALELDDVAAVVLDTPLAMSLLGMTALQRLSSYEVREEHLILRW